VVVRRLRKCSTKLQGLQASPNGMGQGRAMSLGARAVTAQYFSSSTGQILHCLFLLGTKNLQLLGGYATTTGSRLRPGRSSQREASVVHIALRAGNVSSFGESLWFCPVAGGCPGQTWFGACGLKHMQYRNGSHDVFLTRSHETSAVRIRRSGIETLCRAAGVKTFATATSPVLSTSSCARSALSLCYRMRCHRQQTSESDAVPTVTLRSGHAPRPR
jgi:hypothetical protein